MLKQIQKEILQHWDAIRVSESMKYEIILELELNDNTTKKEKETIIYSTESFNLRRNPSIRWKDHFYKKNPICRSKIE